ncbi:lanthionine synthetase C family protein [Streptomyces sp. NPDC059853]|uniref:lanthionine synthetase C family protein n=1 Tax=Streptomyces sp. NPDC059853 TaxID=3346973 RepID=UPI00365475AB
MRHSTDHAAELALSTARTLLNPERVVAALTPQAAATLSDGLSGTALLHACLSRLAPEFATAADRHWEEAARLLGRASPNGIYTGPGALAASLIIGSGYLTDPSRHRTAISKATAWLSARAQGLAHHQTARTDHGRPGAPWAVYDVIRGLSGIGRVLVAAQAAGYEEEAGPGLTAALTTLTTLILTNHGRCPGWWLPAEDHPRTVTVHPSGAATTGLAHGIAGPLALLSLSHAAGQSVPGQDHAIHTAATWLLDWQDTRGSWPPFITGAELNDTTPQPRPGRRHAWCYGTPGIGRALTLAGNAVHEQSLTHAGREAIRRLATAPPDGWDTEGPGLCHGSAGILQAAIRTGQPAGNAAHIMAQNFNAQGLFRFPQVEAGVTLNNPGFLTGATGAALALGEYAGLFASQNSTDWDVLLLLS